MSERNSDSDKSCIINGRVEIFHGRLDLRQHTKFPTLIKFNNLKQECHSYYSIKVSKFHKRNPAVEDMGAQPARKTIPLFLIIS